MVFNFVEQYEPVVVIANGHKHRETLMQIFYNNFVVNISYCINCGVGLSKNIVDLSDEFCPIGVKDSTQIS